MGHIIVVREEKAEAGKVQHVLYCTVEEQALARMGTRQRCWIGPRQRSIRAR